MENLIRTAVKERIETNQLTPCQFLISKTTDDKYVKEVTDLFDKYGVVFRYVIVLMYQAKKSMS